MDNSTTTMEYKCPCCNAGLVFSGEQQQLRCEYCDNTFDLDTVRSCSETQEGPEVFQWEDTGHTRWSDEEQQHMQQFVCQSCGGALIADEHTAATFCPYCGNPTILPQRLSADLKPEALIPFRTTREDAKAAFLKLCKGKPLLPGFFTQEQQLEKITGLYVPFWLYDCSADFSGTYRATRIHTWADSRYTYTKTDHYLLRRKAVAEFSRIPMDGASKMEDSFMESIEPYDYTGLTEFDTAYLSGFLADKYDVPSQEGEARIRQRVEESMSDAIADSMPGYATAVPSARQMNITHSQARYVLLPVWMLNTRYQGKTYTFAMNGQTGKMTGSFPICPKRSAAWFCGLWAAATAAVSLIQLIF